MYTPQNKFEHYFEKYYDLFDRKISEIEKIIPHYQVTNFIILSFFVLRICDYCHDWVNDAV